MWISSRTSPATFGAAALACALLVLSYWSGIENLVNRWAQADVYSHGFLILAISLLLLWDRRQALVQSCEAASLLGVPVLILAGSLLGIGEAREILVLMHVSLVLSILGLALMFGGVGLIRVSFVPIIFLLFAIPLPSLLEAPISGFLQRTSATLGVEFLRMLGASVHLQGHLIDLGSYRLHVAQACSGLHYLHPLLALGFLVAYFFSAPMWQRVLVFLSVIPITLLVNGLRIALIGVLVNNWGPQMAEGLIHDLKAWVIFMGSGFLLMLEVWLLDRLGRKRTLAKLLAFPEVRVAGSAGRVGSGIGWLFLGLVILAVTAVGVQSVGVRADQGFLSTELGEFPSELGGWRAKERYLPPKIEDALAMDDYFLAEFEREALQPVSLYAAYYASQRQGVIADAAVSSMLAGAWRATGLSTTQHQVEGQDGFSVNRIELERNSQRQLVVYWFRHGGQNIASKFWLQWYVLKDLLLVNRTDGALVWLSTVIGPNEDVAEANERILNFLDVALPHLPVLIPN